MLRFLRKEILRPSIQIIRSSSQSAKSHEKKSIFSLFAPTVDEVHLVSSFANWRNIPLLKDRTTGIFHLPPSYEISDGEHEYKYCIRKSSKSNSWTTVIDPYVEKYDSKQRHGLITIRNGQKYLESYEWKYDDIKLPENNQLVIYELYVADFTEKGKIDGITSKIKYFLDLGINAIELMPIHDCMGIQPDWGYNPTHHFALKASYGSKNDLKSLVDECHKHGIRVFIDGVFNQSSLACPLVLIDKDYWYHKSRHNPNDPNHFGAEFNYDYCDENLKIKPAVKYAQDIVRYWISEFHLDGIRFDATKKSDNYDLLRELDRTARSIRLNQPFFTQAQYVYDQSDMNTNESMPVDACWSSTFHGVIAQSLIDTDKFDIDRLKYVISAKNFVNYLTRHDNERLMFLINQLGQVSDDEAFERARLGAIVLMTSVSIPLIWQGDEFGEARQIGRKSPHRKQLPMQWSLMDNRQNRNLFELFQRLIKLRYLKFNTDESKQVNFIYENYDHRLLAFTRLNDEVLILTHFTNELRTNYQIENIPFNGQWIDWLTNESYTVENNLLKIDLKPFEGKVLLRQN